MIHRDLYKVVSILSANHSFLLRYKIYLPKNQNIVNNFINLQIIFRSSAMMLWDRTIGDHAIYSKISECGGMIDWEVFNPLEVAEGAVRLPEARPFHRGPGALVSLK